MKRKVQVQDKIPNFAWNPNTFFYKDNNDTYKPLLHFTFQDFLDELEGKAPNSPSMRNSALVKDDKGSVTDGRKKRSSRSRRKSSVSDGAESLSRSASDSSVQRENNGTKSNG